MDEALIGLDKILKIEKNVDKEKLVYKTNEYTDSFENFQTIKTFSKDIYDGANTLKEADDYQTNSLVKIMNLKKNKKTRSSEKNKKNKLFLKTCMIFLRVDKKFLMLSKVKYFQ